ncbi:MAG: hypothetical protein ACK5GN_05700 [Pseudomonadota bacterium]|jgi:hypothetical protein
MKTSVKSLYAKAHEAALDITRKLAVAKVAPSEKQAQTILFVAGIICLGIGLSGDVFANNIGGWGARQGQIEDGRIANAVAVLFKFLEGSFGALVMAASGIGAILSAAFGQYKMALSCMVVAVGAFILRSMMNTFFNTQSIEGTEYSADE